MQMGEFATEDTESAEPYSVADSLGTLGKSSPLKG